MESKVKLNMAGVVILYYPDENVYENIKSYLSVVETMYILDNSEQSEKNYVNLITKLPKVKYLAFNENKGIAYALNYALTKAKAEGYSLLLTMDQDSSFSKTNINKYIKKVNEYEQKENDIISYAVNYGALDKDKVEKQVITYYITSGSVLNVSKAIELGGFDENLFIDQVDSEFAYRARFKKQRIVTFFDVYLNHHLGNITWHCFGKYKFAVLNHGPLRKYYIFRNMIYVMGKYPYLKVPYYKYMAKEFIKILFFEKKKIKKLIYVSRAFKDAHNKKFGKYLESS